MGAILLGLRWLVGPRGDQLANLAVVSFLLAAVSFLLAGLTVCLMWWAGSFQLLKWLSSPGDRRRPVYGLTDRRAIFLTLVAGSNAVQIQSIPRGSIRPEEIRRVQRPDGSGDLLFLQKHFDPNGLPRSRQRPRG